MTFEKRLCIYSCWIALKMTKMLILFSIERNSILGINSSNEVLLEVMKHQMFTSIETQNQKVYGKMFTKYNSLKACTFSNI